MDLIENQLEAPLTHWYYEHKFNSILKYLKNDLPRSKSLIDIGAGSALFSLELLRQNDGLSCTAIDPGYSLDSFKDEKSRMTYLQKPNGLQGDLYLLTDVLEHVENDVDFLTTYVENAKVGAKFVVTVPAFMILWSGHDIFLKHFKRYRRKELCEVLRKSGLEILSVKYLYVSLFPVALLVRSLPSSRVSNSQLKNQGRFLNLILKLVLKTDSLLGKFMPFGISLIAIAKK